MKKRASMLWLIVGLGLIGAALGYMVGGSKTPVVGVILPAIFGLVVTSVGILSNSGVEKKLDTVVESIKENKLEQIMPILENIRHESIRTPEYMGKLLTAFTILYIVGSIIGTRARIEEWFAKSPIQPVATTYPQKKMPWINSEFSPPTSTDAATWIAIQEKLTSIGYSETQVQELYKIQVTEWKKDSKENKSSALDILNKINATPFTKIDVSPFAHTELRPNPLQDNK